MLKNLVQSKYLRIFALLKTNKTAYYMVYVGQFDETQLKNGVDKEKVERMKAESNGNLRYVKTKLVKKGKQIVGLKIWLMTSDEYMASGEI